MTEDTIKTEPEEAPVHEPTPEDHTMAAVDLALAPVLRSGEAGPVSHSQLQHAVRCIRTALAHAVYGAPEVVDTGGESLDMLNVQRREQRDANQATLANTDNQMRIVDEDPAPETVSAYDKAKADAKAQAALVS